MSIRILAISDTHGHKISLPSPDTYDVVIHSGDFCSNWSIGIRSIEEPRQESWLRQSAQELQDWLNPTRDKQVYILRGNHDFVDPGIVLAGLGWKTLDRQTQDIGDLRVFGFPYTNYLAGEWWGELTPEHMDAAVSMYLPEIETCDIFVSHGPLYGVLDRNRNGIHCGIKSLKLALRSLKKLPKLMLHGHIHEQFSRAPIEWFGMKIYNSATGWNLLTL